MPCRCLFVICPVFVLSALCSFIRSYKPGYRIYTFVICLFYALFSQFMCVYYYIVYILNCLYSLLLMPFTINALYCYIYIIVICINSLVGEWITPPRIDTAQYIWHNSIEYNWIGTSWVDSFPFGNGSGIIRLFALRFYDLMPCRYRDGRPCLFRFSLNDESISGWLYGIEDKSVNPCQWWNINE